MVVSSPLQLSIAALQRVPTNGIHALYDAPGLGVELEVVSVSYKSDKKQYDTDDTAFMEALKGKLLTPVDFNRRHQPIWDLTAEISPAYLMTEIIVDGVKNKIGDGASKDIGEDIFKYMVRFSVPQYAIYLRFC